MKNITTPLQIARWRISHEIDVIHENYSCAEYGPCTQLHDAQRSVSRALKDLGEELCRTPIPWYKEYQPPGYTRPTYPGHWEEEDKALTDHDIGLHLRVLNRYVGGTTTTTQEATMANDYNGWTNYETWNVALYLNNDEGTYKAVCAYANEAGDEANYLDLITTLGLANSSTPDGVRWVSGKLDLEELDDAVQEFRADD